MKTFRLALVASLLVLLMVPVGAQMDQTPTDQSQTGQDQMDQNQANPGQMEQGQPGETEVGQGQAQQGQMNQAQVGQAQVGQQAMVATAECGPSLRAGMQASADVLVNGVVAMRIPASAGGMSPLQRAQTIADRLNQAFASGASWQDTQVLMRNGLWTVNVGNNLIATADVNSARAYGIQTGQLATRWARQSVIAMGGQPQMIAQQLQPVTVAVAGAQQEFGGGNWSTTPVRSVSVINVADGQNLGNVGVAGPQTSLSSVNNVGMFAYAVGNANVYAFVPTTSTTTTVGSMPRAAGVGVVSIPASLIGTGVRTGAAASQEYSSMSPSQWNALVNDQLSGWRVPLNASTKVVPLYSIDRREIVGAAQIVGNPSAVTQAQSVTGTRTDSSVRLNVTSSSPSTISATGQPSMLNGAVVSAVIIFPDGASFSNPVEMMPSTPGATTTPPTP